jgi:hypothetical protein
MSGNGQSKDFTDFSFSIIRQFNSPNKATTVDGYTVTRKEKLFIEEWGAFVPCAPYDTHFIYKDPSNKIGRWLFVCSCGSPAGIVGYNAYKDDASNEGAMLVCLHHAQTGKHADGVS